MAVTNRRRKFSSEEKVRILRRHLVEKVPLSDLCDEYGLHPTVFYRWQKTFFENGPAAFERQRDGQIRQLEKELSRLGAKVARRDEVIAEIMTSQLALKKGIGDN
jgi:transposase